MVGRVYSQCVFLGVVPSSSVFLEDEVSFLVECGYQEFLLFWFFLLLLCVVIGYSAYFPYDVFPVCCEHHFLVGESDEFGIWVFLRD